MNGGVRVRVLPHTAPAAEVLAADVAVTVATPEPPAGLPGGRDVANLAHLPANSATIRTLVEQSRLTIGLPDTSELDWDRASTPPTGANATTTAMPATNMAAHELSR